ncbi:MAG TPA: NRDE family protein [Terriglobales bacterium]|nr:NRDE family protein [Terriglobales bacterium]
MCTFSFIARQNGCLLAMNRDERIARGAGHPPSIHKVGDIHAAYPNDGAGGTWIAANDHGVALALLNWNDSATHMVKTASRGKVIPSLIGSNSLLLFRDTIRRLDLQGMLPFRLIVIFSSETKVCQWDWDGSFLHSHDHPWEVRHWFSSSLSDRRAEDIRGAACQQAWRESDSGSKAWLQRLHAEHVDGEGAFSLCVHRQKVQTLSYSVIECTPHDVEFAHTIGSPCQPGSMRSLKMERAALVCQEP